MRQLTFSQAILEGTDQLLAAYPEVLVMGLGVPTQAGVFGTTSGLVDRYGVERIVDLPAAENGMTGVAVGMAISGLRPIMVHHRVDFSILAMDPLVNQAAKWHYMYGGTQTCPLTVRMIIGRGWGQGPQHSQSLQAWFGHVPGLKVVMPTTPADAKALLVAAVLDPAPVIFMEHRWLYDIVGPVDEALVPGEIGCAAVVRDGTDVTLVGASYMTLECLRAADVLHEQGIDAEVIDLRTISPLDHATVVASVLKTGRLVVADTAHRSFGVAGEVVARVAESGVALRHAPSRITLPDAPTPTTPALADLYYPRAVDIVRAVAVQLGRDQDQTLLRDPDEGRSLDQPNAAFKGPY
jgi:pyruvate dehydrogenase E1 component beta subunit